MHNKSALHFTRTLYLRFNATRGIKESKKDVKLYIIYSCSTPLFRGNLQEIHLQFLETCESIVVSVQTEFILAKLCQIKIMVLYRKIMAAGQI